MKTTKITAVAAALLAVALLGNPGRCLANGPMPARHLGTQSSAYPSGAQGEPTPTTTANSNMLASASSPAVASTGSAGAALGGTGTSLNMGRYGTFSFYSNRPGDAAAIWLQPGGAPPEPWDEFWFDNSGNFNLPGGLNTVGPVNIGNTNPVTLSTNPVGNLVISGTNIGTKCMTVNSIDQFSWAIQNNFQGKLEITAPLTLDKSYALPSTIGLYIDPGCSITLGNYSLTENGPHLSNNLYQQYVYSGTGVVSFAPGYPGSSIIYPEWWGACNGSPDDAPAIQEAVNAAATINGMGVTPIVWLTKLYTCTSLPIFLENTITVDGPGTITVSSTVGSTTDVIQVAPQNNSRISVILRNFNIASASGAPGRFGIHLNGTNGFIGSCLIDNVNIGGGGAGLGGYAIYADGTGLNNGVPVVSTIQNCSLTNGICMLDAGDTVRIINNVINGNNVGISISGQQGGASTLIAQGNNITSRGGDIYLGAGITYPRIINNEMEAMAGFTGAAMVNVAGSSSQPVVGALLSGNNFQTNLGIYQLEIAYANNTTVKDNTFEAPGSGGYGIWLTTSLPIGTIIGSNYFQGGFTNQSIADQSTSGATTYQFPAILTESQIANQSPAVGSVIQCSDCTNTNPCEAGGSGGLARRLSSTWDCQ